MNVLILQMTYAGILYKNIVALFTLMNVKILSNSSVDPSSLRCAKIHFPMDKNAE
jgi:hypothetical protein